MNFMREIKDRDSILYINNGEWMTAVYEKGRTILVKSWFDHNTNIVKYEFRIK